MQNCQIYYLQNRARKVMIMLSILLYIVLITVSPAIGAPSSSRESDDDQRPKADVYFKKGEAFQAQKRYEEAADAYQKAVDIDPSYAEGHSNLGYTFRKMGKFDQAIRSYKRAIKVKPDLAEAHEYIGEAYAEMKKFDLAEKHLDKLKQLGASEADELAAFIAKMKNQP